VLFAAISRCKTPYSTSGADLVGPSFASLASQDGTKCISGGADKAARVMDISTGQTTQVSFRCPQLAMRRQLTGLLLLRALAGLQVAQHEAPIKCVKWVDQNQGLLGKCCSRNRVHRCETDVWLLPHPATGSWDKVSLRCARLI
jgi:WD40 repeat protein